MVTITFSQSDLIKRGKCLWFVKWILFCLCQQTYSYCFEDCEIIPNQSTGEQVVITFLLNICRL